MPKLDILNMQGEQVGEIELSNEIFAVEKNEDAVYEVVKNQLANKRQGTQSVKTRAEVRGGGRKPWRQKGTGRARQGSIRAPHFVGGGVSFAPKPRDYSYTLPKKIRRIALHSVLTSKVENEELIVIDELEVEEIKTKKMVEFLSNVKADKKVLIVMDEKDEKVLKSVKNIPHVNTALVNTINVYDLINCDSLIMTEAAVKKVEEVYA